MVIMNKSDSQTALGLKFPKKISQTILNYLKGLDSLNTNLSIDKTQHDLIVPLIDQIDIEFIKRKFGLKDDIKLIQHNFKRKEIKYNSINEILQTIIPEKLMEFLSTSYDQIGTIAVIDLKDEISEYKQEIGKAIMQIHPSIQTVFRKSKAVGGTTRIRGLEHIYGQKNYETVHREYGLNIYVNLEKIYFSPRLSTEHRRIAEQVKSNECILDMFGAAAPFGLHITNLRNTIVHTLDINENAPEIISHSLELNKKLKGTILIHTGDAIEKVKEFHDQGLKFNRIIMNHPSNALKYLKYANSILKKDGIIHVYSFVQMENHDDVCKELILNELKGFEIRDIHKVRQYSPDEYHTCITIQKL